MQACRYIYNPVNPEQKFLVVFEGRLDVGQAERAAGVIAYLDTLDAEALRDEAHRFYIWSVIHHVSIYNLRYAELLLDYFHGRGLLTCKRCVNAEQKQSRQRYQVLFTIGDKAFTRTYNSIRELKADTGRRPNQLEQSAGRLLLNALKHG
jgi:hypothetical protein